MDTEPPHCPYEDAHRHFELAGRLGRDDNALSDDERREFEALSERRAASWAWVTAPT